MVNLKSKKTGDILWLANILALVALVALLSNRFFVRIDLTEEKRFTIRPQTKDMLKNLDDRVYVEVFLEGNLSPGFKRLRKSIQETLEEFKVYSKGKVVYTFTDPTVAASGKARNEYMQELGQKGIVPTRIVEPGEGQVKQQIIFPGALLAYGGFETSAMLLKGNKASSPEGEINQSIEGIEYELANAIYKLVNTDRKRIGWITGHGELDSLDNAAFNNALLGHYDVFKVDLPHKKRLPNYDAIVIAKPNRSFSESEKYMVDQYLMQGGKAMILLDHLEASMDSASQETYFPYPIQHNLDDQLFRYGIRLNSDLVQDLQGALYPVVTGQANGKPRMQMLPWPFYPMVNHYASHPITRNLDAIPLKFTGSMDTVKAVGIKKTPLLFSGPQARKLMSPMNISIAQLSLLKPDMFREGNFPLAYLLEGPFTSLYNNRFLPEGVDSTGFIRKGKKSAIFIMADGDIARNEVNPKTRQPQPLGFDPYSNFTFANQDLLMNAMAYLVEGNGLIMARAKEISLRPLQKTKVKDEKVKWQVINLVLPLLALLMYGVGRAYYRKFKYANHS